MTVNKVLFSSEKQDWGTPPGIWNGLHQEFNFQLDAATNEYNPLGTKYFYTKEIDGLAEENRFLDATYINPPYGRDIYKWVKKASIENLNNKVTVVMLIPARTDTKWFHEFIWDSYTKEPQEGIEVRFIKGRLRMFNYDTMEYADHYAPFPSMIVVFNKILGYKR